jgi:electron transport complex protein RnfC
MGIFQNIFRRGNLTHGIHPEYHKDTARQPIRRLPFAPTLTLPLSQHLGEPAVPIVHAGQEVVRGEPIALAEGFRSVPLHAPATGVVEAIERRPSASGRRVESIVIGVYGASTQEALCGPHQDIDSMEPACVLRAIQDTGMVGLGGAAFPSHIKLTAPAEHSIHTLVANGCECEPYLTCDHRVMLEQTRDLIAGIRYAMRAARAQRAVIAIEDNKPDAIEAIRASVVTHSDITVRAVPTLYPQGAERILIKSLFGLEVPRGALPSALGIVVNNVATLAQLGRLLPRGQGMIERVVTVTGPGVARPGNYLVPLGTPVSFVLHQVGADCSAREVVLGGPLMGTAVASLDVPITKGVTGVLLFREEELSATSRRRTYPCVKCGNCISVCPMGLNPSQLGALAAKREYELMGERFNLKNCFECGCCTYVCPANIPLVQQMRVAKAILRERSA